MNTASSSVITAKVFDALINGQEADRAKSLKSLNDSNQKINRPHLRSLIIDALQKEFCPKKDKAEEKEAAWIRAWLVDALALINDCDSRAIEVLKNCLHSDPDKWVRYWALAGIAESELCHSEELASDIEKLTKDEEPLVRKLAIAILALQDDDCSTDVLKEQLSSILPNLRSTEANQDELLQWATLRALRMVTISEVVPLLCEIVDKPHKDFDPTYEAIYALGRIQSQSPYAEKVAGTLVNFVSRYRRAPSKDGLRAAALTVLGNLKARSSSSILIQELTDPNPAIVREAARALEKVAGTRIAVARIVEIASEPNHLNYLEEFARALRWMDYKSVVQELEVAMLSGSSQQQEISRTILSEMGGITALEKLRVSSDVTKKYMDALSDAEAKIRSLFETSLKEARLGFTLATLMDVAVFTIGVVLVVLSARQTLLSEGSLDNWVGVGVTGVTGVLGVIYGILIAKPRQKVRESVDHLMYLKVIFLAYLRQLHQVDQAYTRRLLDDETLTYEDINRFSTMVGTTMHHATDKLIQGQPGYLKQLPRNRLQRKKMSIKSKKQSPISNDS
ncbi:HEAT repeat domain-containing protein [Oculatella sp. FACHB-28]|uniref:HEAT repeat domain-containing protein n=1 Tax=Oculatella sp. FACHB-28 TaxID=2692845 RepID=UPI001682B018|nr:HEAT repeat domain-containing protein [Oculatella sp. FACHB-28]MBD2054620.1 HEAT repeat domain-containing protein [Oculatella sp. FACHB-28]